TFRANPDFDTEEVIAELGIGEALVSTLLSKGEPSVVQRTLIRPPSSRMGPISAEERAETLRRSPMGGEYDEELDRESAHEILAERAAEAAAEEEELLAREAAEKEAARRAKADARRAPKEASGGGFFGGLGDLFRGGGRRQSVGEAVVKSAARTATTLIVRELVRGTFGSLGRSKSRRRR
ncbi:MAG: helicase HerA-like domain-containing protein, partial [Pseudomonadota bacterium]